MLPSGLLLDEMGFGRGFLEPDRGRSEFTTIACTRPSGLSS